AAHTGSTSATASTIPATSAPTPASPHTSASARPPPAALATSRAAFTRTWTRRISPRTMRWTSVPTRETSAPTDSSSCRAGALSAANGISFDRPSYEVERDERRDVAERRAERARGETRADGRDEPPAGHEPRRERADERHAGLLAHHVRDERPELRRRFPQRVQHLGRVRPLRRAPGLPGVHRIARAIFAST